MLLGGLLLPARRQRPGLGGEPVADEEDGQVEPPGHVGGEVLVDDPPYLLEVHLNDPSPCWCRLELLPEAGGTIVSLTVASDGPGPSAEAVRDVWVASLNAL